MIKNTLKAKVAEIRWRKEIAGVITNVQGNDVFINTAREVRDVFLQKYILMNENETVQWKFDAGWVTLTKAEMNAIATTVANHIQSQFDWEIAKQAEIDACSTAQELDAINLEE